MPLPRSLLDAVEAHPCFAASYDGRTDVRMCLDPARPLERALVAQCEECLLFYVAALAAQLPNGMSQHQLAQELSRHARQQRGIAVSCGGYHAAGPGFWLDAAYFAAAGLFLLDGHRSRHVGGDLDLLLMALRHGVLVPPDARMTDPKNFATQDIFLDPRLPLGLVTSRQDLLTSPLVQTQRPSGGTWRRVLLAEFLPAGQATPPTAPQPATPQPAASKPATAVPIIVSLTAPKLSAKATAKRPLRVGDICPVCHAEFRERPLLHGTYIGCQC